MYNIKPHPALRAPSASQQSEGGHEESKDLTCISVNKHRIDRNSMRVLFFSLAPSPNIQTLKLTNNGITHHQLSSLVDYLCQDSCQLVNLFFDWNPIYEDDYSVWNSAEDNQLYQRRTPEEQSLFAKL